MWRTLDPLTSRVRIGVGRSASAPDEAESGLVQSGERESIRRDKENEHAFFNVKVPADHARVFA
jgi:hypothetical protein